LNRREEAVADLLRALPEPARERIDRLSPLAAVARLRTRLLIAHGVGDVSIPFTESLRLAQASGGRAEAVMFETLGHTTEAAGSSLGGRLRDAARMLKLVRTLVGTAASGIGLGTGLESATAMDRETFFMLDLTPRPGTLHGTCLRSPCRI
jgi:hypothetical protein